MKVILNWLTQLTSIKKEIDEATFELDKKAVTRYKTFIPDEVKTLVVDDKWMTSIEKSIKTEMDRVSQGLTQRIKELAERYELPLPNLNDEVFNLEKKIMVHLSKMGFRMAVTKPYVKSGPNGFPTGWNVKELGDIADRIVGGGTPSRSNKDYWGHEIPWATVKDFTTFDSVKTQEYITHEGLKNSSSNLIPKGKIIIPTRMALGKAVLFDVDVAINQDLKALFLKDDADTKFVFYWLQSNQSSLKI
ncbi:MAG: restriction endonuclease subunit S [Bacteroidota bacterium]